jgi:hypothetical protein
LSATIAVFARADSRVPRNSSREQVLEQQVPADEPGEERAEGRVGVGVGRAGGRDHRRHLGVAERRDGGREAGEQERQDDGRPGVLRGGGAGRDEDAGADDRGDPQRGQPDGPDRGTVETRAVALSLCDDGVELVRHGADPARRA